MVYSPSIFGLFQKRIAGDDALLELARLRFQEAGLGAEFYASSPGEVDWLYSFKPWPDIPVIVHLPRDINLLNPQGKDQLIHCAHSLADRVYAFVVHDQQEIVSQFDAYLTVLQEINAVLHSIGKNTILFVEYAVGIEPELYCALLEKIQYLPHVSGCLDIGHLGIYLVQRAFGLLHPGEDICSFSPEDKRLPDYIDEIQATVSGVVDMIIPIVRRAAELNKPLHFHLHDGHPLSAFSEFCIPDHLSFLDKIPLPFSYQGEDQLSTMYGPKGLERIIAEVINVLSPRKLSLCLEIHPRGGRTPLGNGAAFFEHWQDKTNAEKMNHWLMVLQQNKELLVDTLAGLGC